MYDIIGDIHGHADELKALLNKLGYTESKGTYSCPGRKVIFVGDYIDRGPKIKETLQIVRSMVENDQAIALMGNHEYNALCFHYPDKSGGHLRKHSIKNIVQHYATLEAFKHEHRLYDDYLNWFLTLPLFFEQDNFRVVHACWDLQHIAYLQQTLDNNRLTRELIYEASQKGSTLYHAVEDTLKGKEINLPNGQKVPDKEGFLRNELRIKWWEDPTVHTYRTIAFPENPHLPEEIIDIEQLQTIHYYPPDEKKVFFGHYWLTGEPEMCRDNICCLDYSVAKGGKLMAGRINGEEDGGRFFIDGWKCIIGKE